MAITLSALFQSSPARMAIALSALFQSPPARPKKVSAWVAVAGDAESNLTGCVRSLWHFCTDPRHLERTPCRRLQRHSKPGVCTTPLCHSSPPAPCRSVCRGQGFTRENIGKGGEGEGGGGGGKGEGAG